MKMLMSKPAPDFFKSLLHTFKTLSIIVVVIWLVTNSPPPRLISSLPH